MDSVFTLQKRKLRHRKRKELAAQGVAELGPEPKLLTPGLDFSPCPLLLPYGRPGMGAGKDICSSAGGTRGTLQRQCSPSLLNYAITVVGNTSTSQNPKFRTLLTPAPLAAKEAIK